MTLRVLAAMSGGVDSAVAAARAADAGHEVTGVHLALSSNPKSYRTGARGCCTLEDARDARRAADVIGIPFYVWDMAERFDRDVVQDFVSEYAAGRTPNPCLRCNEKIKFQALLDKALALGFDAVCTGHHARLADGVLRRSVGRPAPDGRPRYVLDISPVTNTVTVGPREALDVHEIVGERPVWLGEPPTEPRDCRVQLRAHGEVHDCTASLDGDALRIRMREPARGVAKGQAAVLYDGDTVLGSATIAVAAPSMA
jgi:tRNA U34 2-thiouridine synthase MnmA/TrmU